eukprot:1161684-Pelagomonas_calceolata.AAC.2
MCMDDVGIVNPGWRTKGQVRPSCKACCQSGAPLDFPLRGCGYMGRPGAYRVKASLLQTNMHLAHRHSKAQGIITPSECVTSVAFSKQRPRHLVSLNNKPARVTSKNTATRGQLAPGTGRFHRAHLRISTGLQTGRSSPLFICLALSRCLTKHADILTRLSTCTSRGSCRSCVGIS